MARPYVIWSECERMGFTRTKDGRYTSDPLFGVTYALERQTYSSKSGWLLYSTGATRNNFCGEWCGVSIRKSITAAVDLILSIRLRGTDE